MDVSDRDERALRRRARVDRERTERVDTPTRALARGIPSRATSSRRGRAFESTSRDRSRASRRPKTTRARHRASRRDVIPSRVDSSNSHPDPSCFTDDRPRVSFAVSSRSRTRASRRRRCASIAPSFARARSRPSVITNRAPKIPTPTALETSRLTDDDVRARAFLYRRPRRHRSRARTAPGFYKKTRCEIA